LDSFLGVIVLSDFRVHDLSEKGIHPEHLRRLYQRGLLVRIGRGVYMLPNTSISANFSLAEVAKRYHEELSVYSLHFVSTKLGLRVLSKFGSRLIEKPLDRVLIRPDFG
jgi:hypothetical protein